MFDIAWSEMVLIGAVALVVIGPKDLPRVLRTVGQTIGKVRRMAAEFQSQFNEAMREAELADLKKQVEDVGGSVSSAMNTDATPATDYKPIEEPKDFSAPAAGDATKPDETALKEAEAKLASLPPPEPLPPVDIAAETQAQEPAAKPKRVRKPKTVDKAEEAAPVEAAPAVEAAEPAAKANGAEPKPARARRVKEAVAAEEPEAPVPDETAEEAVKPARKRRPKAAKGEETSA